MKHAVVALALAFAIVGCRPKAPPPAPTTVAHVAPDVGRATPPERVETPPECLRDQQCTGYLRCEEGRCVVPPAVDGRETPGMPTATFHTGEKELATIKLEIADEPPERTRGLMFRRKMHPDFGMLFIFDGDDIRSFWMKNTLIELDIVHIASNGEVVGINERAEPMTLSPRQVGEPARYILELVGGRAGELGIEPGVKMKLNGLPPEQSPSE